MYMLKSSGSRIELCGTPIVQDFKGDNILFTYTLKSATQVGFNSVLGRSRQVIDSQFVK